MNDRVIERPKVRAFLAAFIAFPSITRAAEAAEIDRSSHYQWLEDEEYAAAFAQAGIEAGDCIEDEAVERAMKGVYEPNVYQGQFVFPQIWNEEKERFIDQPGAPPLGTWKKSDSLLLALLRAQKPEKYRERVTTELTGKDGGPIEIVERLMAARKRVNDSPPSEPRAGE